MILTIDNLDGAGVVDYTRAVSSKLPLRIQRKLNEPVLCSFSLVPNAAQVPVPLRFGRVQLADDDGVILFTGYIATDPVMEPAGETSAGVLYEVAVSAVSDELLLDMQDVSLLLNGLAESAGQIAQALTETIDTTRFTLSTSPASALVGRYVAKPGESWSKNIGELASLSRNAYRVVASNVNMMPIGSTVHTLNESDGSLQVNQLQASIVKMLANDVTVCGEEEPGAYVTEIFEGDGITTSFELSEAPFFPSSSETQPLSDLFQEATIDTRIWQIEDPGAHLSITGNGLSSTGGNGYDGQTSLITVNSLEVGGSLLVEASGVLIHSNSTGILSGLYVGSVNAQNCIAGFQISQTNGNTVIAPLVNGSVAGSSFSPVAGHLYTLRTRAYCKEMQRVLQAYYATGDGGTQLWGSTLIPAAARLILEVQDTTNGVNQTPVVIYDGTLAEIASVCNYAPINSLNLSCSIRSVHVTRQAPAWVTSFLPNGTSITRRVGTTAQGADCKLERTSKVLFYATAVPQMGELLFVSYRAKHRAIGRKANTASIATQNSTAIPSTSKWIGTVTSPETMSSADCENAANALLNLASSKAAAWKGIYTGWNFETHGDVWPGDVLAVTSASANITANLVVREVQIEAHSTRPQLFQYTIHFANDWADALAIRTTSNVPEDAWLPRQPQSIDPLANLPELSVTSISATEIQIDAGVTPPSGGGFEVHRRDWAFGPGTDSDLVLRSPVANFSIPRESAMEQYYVRMYDSSMPPNYSRFSSAIFVNVQL